MKKAQPTLSGNPHYTIDSLNLSVESDLLTLSVDHGRSHDHKDPNGLHLNQVVDQ